VAGPPPGPARLAQEQVAQLRLAVVAVAVAVAEAGGGAEAGAWESMENGRPSSRRRAEAGLII
jgi:hypothetical protein